MAERWQNVGDTEDTVQQIKSAWIALDRRKQVIIVLASLVIVTTLVFMSRMATAPTMKLLYAGLEVGSAGDVVTALEQRGTVFEVRGGSIYVPANQRDELRMVLAGEGLPANGGKGYELLDTLSGFGTTSQMFDAAYWRAKEGELARTIVASPHVAQARVHIANTGSNPFQRTIDPTASVSVVPTGAPVTPAQANAIRFLIASAVAGLAVENVAVIDANGTLIGSAETAASPSTADDKAQVLRDRVLRLVEARVGAGNAVVEVSVDTVTQTESIRERRFDPEGRVVISTDTEERSDSSTNAAGGDVTVASNLPDGEQAAEGSKANATETRERVNYEVSETEHEILRTPGAVKRLTVAVLVNGFTEAAENGAPVFRQRSEEELSALRDLVASAVGFDAERGDVITLKSMDLPSAAPLGTAANVAFFDGTGLDAMSLIQVGALALVALVLGLFVVRPILARPQSVPAPAVGALPKEGRDRPAELNDGPVLTGEIDDEGADAFRSPGRIEARDGSTENPVPALQENGLSPVERLRSMIGERQEETVEILRSWLEESEENA
ncbi:flagellar basal-body MS-ring/collar protein FliF [Sedimentitalea sp. JM2-8]|uniref:Flagellar M-ring protein n=1 Tax=Sedimentitalea xiamensis TaxID=3050037 RepID=A0ABT7F9B2_9RHOB|nr:flagellar basal-body MS-ring/collar protein FliF [Sedimentitalea xiamensis]MDK3071685.1 flagellar basal-body MS-ring/collar protein FliF [Sedimentitalea xiamensis]